MGGMNGLASFLNRLNWPMTALFASALMLAAAHGFERFAYLDPCPLCLRQREVYWAAIAMAATGLVLSKLRRTPRFMAALNILIGLVFATGAVVAGYHAGVEMGLFPAPQGCAAGSAADVLNMDLGGLDERMATASCTDVPWSFLGLSMAAWNALISAGLALASFQAARRAS